MELLVDQGPERFQSRWKRSKPAATEPLAPEFAPWEHAAIDVLPGDRARTLAEVAPLRAG